MAKISQREKVLLGYSPNSVSNIPSRRSSDVDFSDVFGGPPRRSSVKDNFEPVDEDEEEESEGGRSGSGGPWEKPVFGDEVAARRRYTSGDFFDDIFRGDQPSSCNQSPRSMPRRDPFSSAPGSRIMSPSRPLLPMAEPFATPAKFSLPAALASADPVVSPPINQNLNSSSSPTPRFNQAIQNYDALHADVRSSYRPSPLSHQNMVGVKELARNKIVDGTIAGPGFSNDSKGLEVPVNSAQFHFAIYKWASKGVPLVMSLRKKSHETKEEINFKRSMSANERVGSDNLQKVKVDVSFSYPSSAKEIKVKDGERCNDAEAHTKTEVCQYFDDISRTVPDIATEIGLTNVMKQACEDPISLDLEDPVEGPSLSKKSSKTETDNVQHKSRRNIDKSNMRPLSSFFLEEEKGNRPVTAQKSEIESRVKVKGKPSMDDVSNCKISKSKVSQSFREEKEERKKEGTGKVKEFVKIFNHESYSKAKKNASGLSQSTRWNDSTTFEEEYKVNSVSSEMNNEEEASKVDHIKILPDAPDLVDGNSFQPEKQRFVDSDIGSVFGTPSLVPEPSAEASADSAPSKNGTPNNDITSREVPHEITMISEESQDETKSYERKVLQWSKGKEGNIRALLSTLQYVLWPNCGWKPVPLVDIIEANAVKRAYQKALLCLHPDKLQQKGAAGHQKFIAEKVFDILQEAWDHFNSLGLL